MASIWSGKVKLPAQHALWKDFWDTVEDRGGLKSGYQWLDSETGDGKHPPACVYTALTVKYLAYLADFINRINQGAARHGGKQISTPPDSYVHISTWMPLLTAL